MRKLLSHLYGTSGKKLNINYKISKAHVCNSNICFKNIFYLVKDLDQAVILGTLFIVQIYPFKADYKGLTTKNFGKKIFFEFSNPPSYKDVKSLKEAAISKIIHNINLKRNHIQFLKEEISFQKIEKRLQESSIKNQIIILQTKIEQEICSTIPNAFWDRKKHVISLPYNSDFHESNIPTKSRPIQMKK